MDADGPDAAVEPGSAGANPSPRFWAPLATVLLAAAVLRILSLLMLSELPWLTDHQVDSLVYHRAAQSIASGQQPPAEVLLRMSPGYFQFLGAVYWLLGDGPWPIRIVQLLLGMGVVGVTWDTARRLFGPRWAILTTALAAFYGPYVFYEQMVLATTLAVFLHAALLWSVVRQACRPDDDRRGWAMVGLVWGLCTAVRPNALLLVLPLAAAAWRLAGTDRRARLQRLGWLLAGGLAVIVPLATLHAALAGEPVLLGAHGGLNFYIGNGPSASGTFDVPEDVPGSADPIAQYAAFQQVAQEHAGRELGLREADVFWYARTFSSIADDPGRWLGLMVKKVHLFFNGRELSNVFDYEFAGRVHPIIGAPLVQFSWIVPVGMMGTILLLWSGQPGRRLVAWLNITVCASVVLFFVVARLRLPVVPGMMIAATAGVVAMARQVRQRSWRPLVAMGLGTAVAVAIALPVAANKHFEREYFKLAVSWHEQQRWFAAERAYRQSLRVDPDYLPSRHNLAVLYERLGQQDRAREQWRQVARTASAEGNERELDEARRRIQSLGAAPSPEHGTTHERE